MSYKLTRYERETIINFNEAEATAGVYTHNVALRNKLLKLCLNEKDIRIIRQGDDVLEVEVPKKWVKISPPKKLSEKTLSEMRKHMKSLHDTGLANNNEGGKTA